MLIIAKKKGNKERIQIMGKYIRIFIVIIMVLGLAIMAESKAAWAANPTAGADPSSLEQADQSVSPDGDNGDDDCEKDKNKKKDKDKDKCKDDDGTVRPPDDDIEDCERDDLSVGGIATLQIKRLRDRDCLRAHTESSSSLSGSLSGTALSDVLVLELPTRGAKVKICFAVPPGNQVKIYSSSQGSWRALKTTIKNGVACAQVSNSGSYTLAGR
jgi:hypothetical protein